MKGEGDVTRSIIDEVHSSDMKGNKIEGENGVTRSINNEVHSSDI